MWHQLSCVAAGVFKLAVTANSTSVCIMVLLIDEVSTLVLCVPSRFTMALWVDVQARCGKGGDVWVQLLRFLRYSKCRGALYWVNRARAATTQAELGRRKLASQLAVEVAATPQGQLKGPDLPSSPSHHLPHPRLTVVALLPGGRAFTWHVLLSCQQRLSSKLCH